MPDKKKPPPSAGFRRNLYWTDDMDSMVEKVAEKFHKEGAKGMFNSAGEVNRSAVLRHLLQKELGQG